MFDRAQLQTALYEISMHIGTSTDPSILVKDAISAFMRQLDCSGALVCREGAAANKRFYMLPKNLLSQVLLYKKENLPKNIDKEFMQLSKWIKDLKQLNQLLLVFPPKDLKTSVNPVKTLTPRFITRTLEKIKKNN